MIELLGVGIRSARGPWLFRRVCARLETSELTCVVSADREARVALLDVVAGRRIPIEGRAWVNGRPLMDETASAIRSRVGEVHAHAPLVEEQSVLSNLLLPTRWAPRLLRSLVPWPFAPSRDLALRALQNVGLGPYAYERVARLDEWRRRRISVARAMFARPDRLVAREVDEGLSRPQAASVLGVLRTITRSERLPVLVSASEPTLVCLFADRVLVLAGGALIFDGPPIEGGHPAAQISSELQATG